MRPVLGTIAVAFSGNPPEPNEAVAFSGNPPEPNEAVAFSGNPPEPNEAVALDGGRACTLMFTFMPSITATSPMDIENNIKLTPSK